MAVIENYINEFAMNASLPDEIDPADYIEQQIKMEEDFIPWYLIKHGSLISNIWKFIVSITTVVFLFGCPIVVGVSKIIKI